MNLLHLKYAFEIHFENTIYLHVIRLYRKKKSGPQAELPAAPLHRRRLSSVFLTTDKGIYQNTLMREGY